MRRKIGILLLSFSFILSTAGSCFSADQFLDACLKIAEKRNQKLAVAKEQVKLSEIRVTRSVRNFFPVIAAQRKTVNGKTLNAEYQSEELTVKGTQTIYEGQRTRANYLYDSKMVLASQYNHTKIREELFATVKQAYYELLSSQMEYNSLSLAFEEIEKMHNKVIVEFNAKAISELDLLESENFRDKVKDMLETSKDSVALARKKLAVLLEVEDIESIPVPMPESLTDDVPSVTYTLKECTEFAKLNNIDLKTTDMQIIMSDLKKTVSRSKVLPKLYLDGSYGLGGEAFVTQPLDLSTIWSVYGRLSWGLWGNSLEITSGRDTTEPKQITDVQSRIDGNTTDIKLGLLDDLNYFVDSKESSVNNYQAKSDQQDTLNKLVIDVQKNYNDYDSSMRDARTLRNEIILKKRKLALLRKRNLLYDVPTVQVMEESWKYAETLGSYAKALYKNYAAVTELEKLTLVTLR